MRCRLRHFNPARAGCQVALDARYITGIASGAAVQTWPARSGTTINAAQATLGNRPTMGAINGAQALVFDGTDDLMPLGTGSAALTNGASSCMITTVAVADAVGDATQITVWIGTGTVTSNARASLRVYSSSAYQVTASGRRQDGDASAALSGAIGTPSAPSIVSGLWDWANNSVRAVANGVESTSATFTSGGGTQSATDSLSFNIGALGVSSSRHKGRIGAVLFASPIPSAALRKRIRHHLGFSFRIATA